MGNNCKQLIYLNLTRAGKKLSNELSIKRANALSLKRLLKKQNGFCRTPNKWGNLMLLETTANILQHSAKLENQNQCKLKNLKKC